jgi:hypothetical protein
MSEGLHKKDVGVGAEKVDEHHFLFQVEAVITSSPPGLVACCHRCLCIARLAGVDNVAGIAVLSLSACIKDPLPDWRSARVGRLCHRASCVNRCFWALRAAVIPRAALLAYARRRAFGLLHGRLMSAGASQCMFCTSSVEGVGMARSSVAAAMSF